MKLRCKKNLFIFSKLFAMIKIEYLLHKITLFESIQTNCKEKLLRVYKIFCRKRKMKNLTNDHNYACNHQI